jgi:hypothetical protein
MKINKKINLKKYFGYSCLHLGLTYFVVNNMEEFLVIILVYLATVFNQWMLIDSVEAMAQSAAGVETGETFGPAVIFLGKTLLLLAALSFGVHIMGKRIIIPLLNYVVQIFILYYSFRRKDCEQ